MAEWKPKPYQPHQSWAGRGPKTSLQVDDAKYREYPPGKGPYPGNLSKSAYDAERRATGKMGKGEAARYDHAVKIAKTMKEAEASRQKSIQLQSEGKTSLLNQQTTRSKGGGGGGKFGWIKRAINRPATPYSLLKTDKNF